MEVWLKLCIDGHVPFWTLTTSEWPTLLKLCSIADGIWAAGWSHVKHTEARKPLHSSNSSASDHLCIKCTGLGADGLRVAWGIQWVICQNGIRVVGSKLFGSLTQISSLSFYFVKRTFMIRIWDVQILVEIATQPWKALVAPQAPRAPWKESGGKRCGSPLVVFLQIMDIKTHQTSSTTNKCDQIKANPYQRKSFAYGQIGSNWDSFKTCSLDLCVFSFHRAGHGLRRSCVWCWPPQPVNRLRSPQPSPPGWADGLSVDFCQRC